MRSWKLAMILFAVSLAVVGAMVGMSLSGPLASHHSKALAAVETMSATGTHISLDRAEVFTPGAFSVTIVGFNFAPGKVMLNWDGEAGDGNSSDTNTDGADNPYNTCASADVVSVHTGGDSLDDEPIITVGADGGFSADVTFQTCVTNTVSIDAITVGGHRYGATLDIDS